MDTTKMDMFKLLDGMKPIVFGNVKPDGSPEFPAKSCKEIQMCFPEATSGMLYEIQYAVRMFIRLLLYW